MRLPAAERPTHHAPPLRWWRSTRSLAPRIPEQVVVGFRLGVRGGERSVVLACAVRSGLAAATVEILAPALVPILAHTAWIALTVGLGAWLRCLGRGARAPFGDRMRMAVELGLQRALGRRLRFQIVGTGVMMTSDETVRPAEGASPAELPEPRELPSEAKARKRTGTVSATIPVLMYHAIADDGSAESARWRVSVGAFEQHLAWLEANGYRSLSIAELAHYVYRGRVPEGRRVVLSFDDAFGNFRTEAWPRLKRHGFGALLFVVAGRVGRTSDWDRDIGNERPLLSWPEIAEVASEGVEIGSHALDHDSLWAKTPAAVVEQLCLSRQLLRRHTARETVAVAYPHGAADAVVRQCARQAGYLLGFGTRPGPVTLASSPYDLPRLTVEPRWTPAELSQRLSAFSPDRP